MNIGSIHIPTVIAAVLLVLGILSLIGIIRSFLK